MLQWAEKKKKKKDRTDDKQKVQPMGQYSITYIFGSPLWHNYNWKQTRVHQETGLRSWEIKAWTLCLSPKIDDMDWNELGVLYEVGDYYIE